MKKHTAVRFVAALLAAMLWLGTAAAQPATLNLLLIGVDKAAPGENGRSDTMMLAQITPETGEVRLVSFLRDLYLPIPGYGRTRLNAAYYYGGAELLKRTLEENFGVRIDRTAAVDFAAMADLIDQLGGVTVDIDEAERRELNRILKSYGQENGIAVEHLLVAKAGSVMLGGLQALSYSRIRFTDSDFVRVSRQQQVLSSLLEKLKTMDAMGLMALAMRNLSSLSTDLTLKDVFALLPLLRRDGGLALYTARVPFDGACRDIQVDQMWVLEADMAQNRRLLDAFLSGE